MGCLVADVLHQGDLSGFLWGLRNDDLTVLRVHILDCEPHQAAFAESLGLTVTGEPSWWMTVCLPQIDREVQRRNRPKWTGGRSRIADLKASYDLAEVASRYTTLKPRGSTLVGRCPFHEERSPSFTVYPDQHYHCFGCQAHGDVLDLVQRMALSA